MMFCIIHNINWPFWPVDIGCAVLPAWISCPLPAAFSGSPTWGSLPGIPCRRSCGFQGSLLIWQKNRHTTTWTWPSLPGIALVRVRYVAIRKSKTCSDSFGSRAGTLSKYVILNCWNRLPQKSSRVNKKIWKYATFGGLQEKAMKTLAKRERTGWYQPLVGHNAFRG